MRRWLMRVGVALVVLSLAGMLYAPPGRGPGRAPRPGRDIFGPRTESRIAGYLEGVIRKINATDDGEVVSIVVAGKKKKDGSDGPVATLTLNAETQVYIKDAPARPSDLAVGQEVIAGCAKARDGAAPPLIVLIRVLKSPDDAKPAEDKPADEKPADDAPADPPAENE